MQTDGLVKKAAYSPLNNFPNTGGETVVELAAGGAKGADRFAWWQ
jgi:hypothetical protein